MNIPHLYKEFSGGEPGDIIQDIEKTIDGELKLLLEKR